MRDRLFHLPGLSARGTSIPFTRTGCPPSNLSDLSNTITFKATRDHTSAYGMPDETSHYDLAGRDPSNTFRDLRSTSRAHRRHRREMDQYWHYRTVKTGQVGLSHIEDLALRAFCRHRQSTLPISADGDQPVIMTRTELWREAQRWRPPRPHRRPKWEDTGPPRCTRSAPRRTKRHARSFLEEDVVEARDPWFMAYVTGRPRDADEREEHVFRRCDVCWPELGSDWVRDEMLDASGEAVGQLGQRWEVEVWEMEGSMRYGFAGRAEAGALFLMGEEDWTGRMSNPWLAEADEDSYEDGWESDGWLWEESGETVDAGRDHSPADEMHVDTVSMAPSWQDLRVSRGGQSGSDDWDVLSLSSSWSCLSV